MCTLSSTHKSRAHRITHTAHYRMCTHKHSLRDGRRLPRNMPPRMTPVLRSRRRPARPVPLSLVLCLAQRPHGLVGGEVGDRVVPRGRRRLLRGALRCMRPPQRHVLSAQLDRGYGITPLTYDCHSQARARVLRSSCARTKCSTRRFSRSRHVVRRTSISDRPPRPSS